MSQWFTSPNSPASSDSTVLNNFLFSISSLGAGRCPGDGQDRQCQDRDCGMLSFCQGDSPLFAGHTNLWTHEFPI